MTHKLIKKIEQEQINTERKACNAALTALGISKTNRENIMTHFCWWKSVARVAEKVQTPRTQKCLLIAHDRYLCSLEEGMSDRIEPLTVKDWSRAGQAMNRVFRAAVRMHTRD